MDSILFFITMHRSTTESGLPALSSFARSGQRPNQLTDAELNESFERKLVSVNPQRSSNVVHFDYKTRQYVPNGPPSPVISLLHLKSSAILKTSPEALESDDFDEYSELFAKTQGNSGRNTFTDGTESNATEDVGEAEAMRAIYMAARPQKIKKIINAFSHCEEATQTSTPSFRTAESQTIPPLTKDYSSSVSSSIIFDAYDKDFLRNSKRKKPTFTTKALDKSIDENKLMASLKLIERVICQNVFSQVYLDFRYFDDPADEFRTDGRLLPLWTFSLPRRSLPVTDVEWSHDSYDLFAATFGDCENTENGGAVAIYTIKNCFYPEFLVETKSPALCVSLNSKYPSLLAVGFLDGNISVYDSLIPHGGLLYTSGSENKHSSCVNAIRWEEGETRFYSISSDGSVKHWKAMITRLVVHICFHIEIPSGVDHVGPDGVKLNVKCGGLRFAFHPNDKNIYLVGTTEGFVMKCSTLRCREPLFIYKGHRLPVYRISYNPFVPAIFISCGADSTIKIWADNRCEPLVTYDVGAAVIDIKWSPYTSTVFAAVTRDGYVHIYDLNINHYQALHKQKVLSTAKSNEPTQLSFNKKHPVVIVADRSGHIFSFKLSPNLRIPAKASRKDTLEPKDLEIRKLHAFLSIMKPKLVNLPVDVPAL